VTDSHTSPLAGKRVIVTRAVQQSSELLERLTALGAIALALPLVSFAPPEDFTPLDAALRHLPSFNWIIFTSANAVHAVADRARSLQIPFDRSAASPGIAAVGPATRDAAENAGFSVDHVAKTHLGLALAQELADRLRGKSVFLPRSDRANPDLPAALRALDTELTEVVAYRSLPPTHTDKDAVETAVTRQTHAVIFFSPSAVHHLIDLLGRDSLPAVQDRVALAAVGPVTARALREAGVDRIVIAADTTSASVVDALQAHFAAAKQTPAAQAGAKLR
jgi:uroporphyrinogen-III synthase